MTDVRAVDPTVTSGGFDLETAVENIAEGFMLFSPDELLVVCNPQAREFYHPIADQMVAGAEFGTLARALATNNVVDLGGELVDTWVAARIKRHRDPGLPTEQKLVNGRWLRVSESVSSDGGMVTILSDITLEKEREQTVIDGERRYQQLNEIGVALSSEKNLDKLLELILLQAKAVANADGGTIYLYVNVEPEDEWQKEGRIDRRCGGDRRCGRDRRIHLDSGDGEAAGRTRVHWKRSDRRGDVDRRQHPDGLKFAIMRNDSLKIAMGGTTGKEIPFPPLRIYDPVSGEGNVKNVATLVALTGKTVNIPDAYTSTEFDFSGTKAFDANSGYRSTSFLTIPMLNKKDEVIGVLQLINAQDPETGEVRAFLENEQLIIESLASQAAVSLDNQLLLEGQKNLLDAFIQLMASAIDEKSPYTGGHCERVPVLTEMLAEAACKAEAGPFKNFTLNDEEMYELHIAGWMHDCGKVTTPEYVVDKSTKLETIYDRIGTVKTRFEVIKRDAEIAYLKDLASGQVDAAERGAQFHAEIERLDDDCAFIAEANVGGEFMDDEKKERVRQIAKLRWRGLDGEEHDFLDENEVYNLCIGRGTLTNEERLKINDHIVVTIEMLEKLPFPKNLSRVPEYAGGHHEKMDGTGYPRRLRREQMSTPARMMAIADIFEALTAADRPYKKAKTLSEAMRIMGFMKKDNHIDPQLFELFVDAGVYKQYAERFLSPDQIDEVDHDKLLGRGG